MGYGWVMALKYRQDQQRVPAGSPDGGRWTSEHGRSRLPFDRTRSEYWAGVVDAQPKDCWRNAAMAAISSDGTYVEGWVVIPVGVPIEHGWVEKDGGIIDPTLTRFDDAEQNEYFPGKRWSPDELMAAVGGEVLLPLSNMMDAGQREAFDAALSHLGMKYSADQPRVPAGSLQGGQWTTAGSPHSVARELRDEAERQEPLLTSVVAGAVSAAGGEMEGLEHRLKGAGSIAGKLERIAREHGTTASEARGKMKDLVRYTAVFEPGEYSSKVRATLATLGRKGYTKYDDQFKNYWEPGDAYDGYNCVLQGKDGYRFELQFHTPSSWDVKMKAHELYAGARDMGPGKRRTSLVEQMGALWQGLARPQGWQGLPGVMRHSG